MRVIANLLAIRQMHSTDHHKKISIAKIANYGSGGDETVRAILRDLNDGNLTCNFNHIYDIFTIII